MNKKFVINFYGNIFGSQPPAKLGIFCIKVGVEYIEVVGHIIIFLRNIINTLPHDKQFMVAKY